MSQQVFVFESFLLDPAQRSLTRGGAPVEISSRYLDALHLMVREPGQLIRRERFLDDVWKGIPVTDEALSQCVANLRRLLGDDAGKPHFIETVPKHGYRFVAPVEVREMGPRKNRAFRQDWISAFALAAAGTIGGGLAGVAGGFLYGLGASPDPLQPAVGAASFLLVMLSVNILAAAIGGFGVGGGIAVAHRFRRPAIFTTAAGAALGGLLVGGAVKLLGVDTFSVLLGKAPVGIGGGLEGLVLGGAVGLGSHLSLTQKRPWPSVSGAAIAGGIAGAVLPLLGGRMMAASLDSLAAAFPNSPLKIDPLGRWFGEDHFGIAAQVGFSAIEGLLFGAAVGAAIRYANSLLREIRAS